MPEYKVNSKDLCKAVCTPSLNGYSPNPLYEQGYCPSYMQQQCNADGSMFEEQWDKHQNDIKDFIAQRLFALSMGYKPVPYTQGSSISLPPTTSDVQNKYLQPQVSYSPSIIQDKKPVRKTKKKTTKKSGKKK